MYSSYMDSVKPPRRRDRTATRAAIVGAARALFSDQGYGRTTITDVAASAGVAPQTVYWAFGSKARLVSEIREAWLAEARTDERLPAVLMEEVPGDRLAAFAAFMTAQWETGSAAVAIQQDAMRVDAAVALDVAETLNRRATALSQVTEPLGPHLRPELTVAGAHDRLLALSMVEVYVELRGRGWSADDYRDWLSEVLQWQLLGAQGADRESAQTAVAESTAGRPNARGGSRRR